LPFSAGSDYSCHPTAQEKFGFDSLAAKAGEIFFCLYRRFDNALLRGADNSFHICYDFYKKGCNLSIRMLK